MGEAGYSHKQAAGRTLAAHKEAVHRLVAHKVEEEVAAHCNKDCCIGGHKGRKSFFNLQIYLYYHLTIYEYQILKPSMFNSELNQDKGIK